MWSEQNNCTRTTPACVTYILFTMTHRNYLKRLFLFPALQQITQTILSGVDLFDDHKNENNLQRSAVTGKFQYDQLQG